MKIIVTGSAGFIGTHVCRLLDGHDVLEIDRMEPRVHGKGKSGRRAGSIREHEHNWADCVIHLGAQVGVHDSMTDPMRYVSENTFDTASFARRARCRVVVASSMSVYGDPKTRKPITEDHPVDPASVYGLTKYDQERLCALLNPETVVLRFFNVYGPGQALHNPYTGVLANFANWFMNDEPPTIYEDGFQTRDFIYVEDVARAVVAAATTDVPRGIYNVSTGVATTIRDIAALLRSHLGGPEAVTTFQQRPGDIRHCIGDPSRLQAILADWHPRALEDGIASYAADLVG